MSLAEFIGVFSCGGFAGALCAGLYHAAWRHTTLKVADLYDEEIEKAVNILRSAEINCTTIETLPDKGELGYVFMGLVRMQLQSALRLLGEDPTS